MYGTARLLIEAASVWGSTWWTIPTSSGALATKADLSCQHVAVVLVAPCAIGGSPAKAGDGFTLPH